MMFVSGESPTCDMLIRNRVGVHHLGGEEVYISIYGGVSPEQNEGIELN